MTTASATPIEQLNRTLGLDDDVRRHRRGAPVWGRLEVDSPPRWGWNAYRLRVYPPGLDAAGRRRLWFDDWAPLLGALAGVLVFAAGSSFLDPAWLLALLPAGIALAIAVAHRSSAAIRRAVRFIEVSFTPDGDDRMSGDGARMYGDGASLARHFAELTDIDRALAAHEIDEREYTSRWLVVYESLPRRIAARRGRRHPLAQPL